MSVDLHHTTKAVVKWLENDAMRFLTKGDPETKPITLTTTFDSEAAFFELRVPVKLKGLKIVTKAILRFCASDIASLELLKSPTMPPGVREEFDSTALSLDFTLKDPPTVIVHIDALEPLSANRKPSGTVLDMIRDLSKAKALSIYVEAQNAPNELQNISDAVSQGLFTSCNVKYHIASMYGGIGGKLVDLSPPSYEEAAASPPPPPPIKDSSKKRPRQDSDSERDDFTLLWAELRALKQLPTRVEALEAQNEKLKQEYAELGKDMDILREKYEKSKQRNVELVKDVNNLREECKKSKQTNTEFVEDINNLQEKYDALEDRLADLQSENEAFVDTYDGQLTELRQDMHHFEGVVGCIQEGHVTEESLQMIQSVVIQEMRRRLADG